MKKKLKLAGLAILFCANVFSQPVYNNGAVPLPPIVSYNPQTLSQGGAFTANAFGYNSFFYNPAGFAVEQINPKTGKKKNGDITALSISAWTASDTKLLNILSNPSVFMDLIVQKTENLQSQLAKIRDIFNAGGDITDSVIQALAALAEVTDAKNIYDAMTGFFVDKGIDEITEPPKFEDLISSSDTDQIAQKLQTWLDETGGSNKSNSAIIQEIINNPDLQQEFIFTTAKAIAASGLVQDMFSLFPSSVQAGFNIGVGVVKSGFGIGFSANFDLSTARGNGFRSIVSPTFIFNAGYAFKFLDKKLLVGFNIRPMLKLSYLRFDLTEKTLIEMFSNPDAAADMIPIYSGFGAGLDIGAIYRLNDNFNIGLVLKDAPTFFQMYSTSFSDFTRARTPSFFDKKMNNLFYVPPDLVIGASWTVNPNSLFSASVSAQIGNWIPQLVYQRYYKIPFDPLSIFNIGASIQILKMVTLSAGYGNNFLSGGIGLDVLFFDIYAAVIYNPRKTDGANAWGASLEFALRF